MSRDDLPAGWSESDVREVLDHYESQSEEEALAEDEAAFGDPTTTMEVPAELVPEVQALIAKHRAA